MERITTVVRLQQRNFTLKLIILIFNSTYPMLSHLYILCVHSSIFSYSSGQIYIDWSFNILLYTIQHLSYNDIQIDVRTYYLYTDKHHSGMYDCLRVPTKTSPWCTGKHAHTMVILALKSIFYKNQPKQILKQNFRQQFSN